MGLRFWRSRRAKDAFAAPRSQVNFSFEAPAEITGAPVRLGIAPRISRAEALQVPAVLRSRNLVAGTLASLPHTVHGPDRREVNTTYLLGGNIDPNVPNSVTLAATYEDLFFEGLAWWKITKLGWHGFPVEATYVPTSSVSIRPTAAAMPSEALISQDNAGPKDGDVYIDGQFVPDELVIRFDSPNPPLLTHAARAIRACLQLDMQASRIAASPTPQGVFTPADGATVDPGDADEIEAMLAEWNAARSANSWGYVGAALKIKPLSWSPEQLQLADSRQHAVLEIARAAGVDPEDLGVSTTSRTYANSEQRRRDLLDFTIGAFVSAVQDRLSMRDVLPRGYVAKVNFDGFLRSDTAGRYGSYATALTGGWLTLDEVRELEDRPALTGPQRPAAAPTAPVKEVPMATARQSANGAHAAFSAPETVDGITFDLPDTSVNFRVNPEKRTISGLAVPWGKVARSGFYSWRFSPGSLTWVDEGRVKLNREHDRLTAFGRAVRLENTDAGLDVTFKVARGEEGDRALALAEDGVLDGFSIEVDFTDEDSWQPDPTDESVRLVRSAKLRGVALTAAPSFDDARVDRVAASRTQEGNPMTVTAPEPTAPAAPAPAPVDLTTFTNGLTEAIGAAMTAALDRLDQAPGRQPVRAAGFTVTEPPVYTLQPGVGRFSLVRDAWQFRQSGDQEAYARLTKYRAQQDELQKRVGAAIPSLDAQFTTGTTANISQIIPPGYRPDLYVPQLFQGRPLGSGLSQGQLSDATPFTVPRFATQSGLSAVHTEGTNPTDGTITAGTVTVTPTGISGLFKVTRELVDAANPAIDMIALNAMRESFSQQTEARVYAELNGANGVGGTITSGFVPSGAAASTVSLLAAGTDFYELLDEIRRQMAVYPFRRFGPVNRLRLSQEGFSTLVQAKDTTNRPLLPSLGAQNTMGMATAVGEPTQGLDIDGLAGLPAWSMTGNAAGDADVIMWNVADAWVWESPILTFRFEERSGPALIELALFGYHAVRILRPLGFTGIRATIV